MEQKQWANSTTHFTTQQQSQNLENNRECIRLSQENKVFLQETKKPCKILQGVQDTRGGDRTHTTVVVRGF